MFQNIFLQMHQTIEQLNHDFLKVGDIDEELSLLEKYLSIKELSEDLSVEINKLNIRLREFEYEHGLIDITQQDMEEAITPQDYIPLEEEQEDVVIELDESDFMAFQKGIGFYDLLMYDQAIVHLEQIINKYPDFNLARLYTAMTYFKKKKYIEAKREIHVLFQLSDDPDLISLGYNILGMINGYEKDFEKAEENFKQAILLKNNWQEPKYNLAIILFKSNKLEESIELLEELYQNNSNDWEVLLYLGKAYQKLNKYELAGEFFKQTYSITKKPVVIQQIANHFEHRRNFKQANYWYRKLLEMEPSNMNALLGLAKNSWLDGEKELGVSLLKKCLTIERGNIEASLLYAWILTDTNDQKSLEVMNELVDQHSKQSFEDPKLIANLARLYHLNHDSKKSDQFCSILFNSTNKSLNSLGHITKGLIYLDLNKPEEALYHLELTIPNMNFPYIDFYKGYTHYLLGNLEKAKAHWSSMLT